MNFRASVVLSVAMISTACGVLGEDTGTATDDVTVTPTGTSTLGTLEIQIPPALGLTPGTRSLSVSIDPVANPGHGEYLADEMLVKGGSVRVPPGTYCVRVTSMVGHNLNQLTTQDCSVEVPAAGKRTYALGTVVFRAEDVAFLHSQDTMTSGVYLLEPTAGMNLNGRLWLEPNRFAATKSSLVTTVFGESFTTDVPEGGTVDLKLPTEDRVVRFSIGAQPGSLPLAFDHDVTWKVANGPASWQDYATPRSELRDLAFFTDPSAQLVVSVAGIDRSFPMNEVKSTTVYPRILEVTDVEDTDDEGKLTKIQGTVGVRDASGRSLRWGTATSFQTGHGVHVWSGKYDVRVTYWSAGEVKTYDERVNVP